MDSIDALYQRNLIFQLLCALAESIGYKYSISADSELPGMDAVILQVGAAQISFHIPHEDVVLREKGEIRWDGHDRETKWQTVEETIRYLQDSPTET